MIGAPFIHSTVSRVAKKFCIKLALKSTVRRYVATSDRFASDRHGVAAVEFAMILPLMLLIYLGSFDVSREVMASKKAGVASQTVAQLIGQQSTSTAMTASQVSSFIAASAASMAPFPTSTLTTTVSAIDLKTRANGTCCDATVRWSYTQGGTLRPCNVTLTQVGNGQKPSSTTIPIAIATPTAAVLTAGTQPKAVIVSDVVYGFRPLAPAIDKLTGGNIPRTTYVFPRSSGQVTLQTPVNAPSGQSGTVCS